MKLTVSVRPMSRIKCPRDYETAPVAGFGVPYRVYVLRPSDLPGYFVARVPSVHGPAYPSGAVLLHESFLGEEWKGVSR